MRSTLFDFTPLARFGIGFDRMIDLLDGVTHDAADTYPPYNVEKTGEKAYRISLAVAGFRPDELSIMTEPNTLIVSGKKAESEEKVYLHQGIAARSFERQFTLADHVKIAGASLQQGMLTIDLVHEVPEAMKPRRIAIAHGDKRAALKSQKAT